MRVNFEIKDRIATATPENDEKSMPYNGKLILVICLATLGLTACSKKQAVVEDVKYVKTVTLCQTTPQDNYNRFSGIIKAQYEPQLSFRVAGKVIKRYVDIGQPVKKGQVLASLDPTDYKLSEDSQVANLAAAKSNYMTQEQNLARYTELLKENFVSQSAFDTQKSSFESAKAKYQEALNNLANSKNQVAYTNLTAPGDGVIASINMDAGKVVSAADIVATMNFSGPKEIEIQLPETQINSYTLGQDAAIQIWSNDKIYHGKIRLISQSNDAQTRTYTSRITLTDGDNSIKYGMSAYAQINSKNQTNGLQIPTSSIYPIDGKSYVWLVSSEHTVKSVPISVSSADAEMAIVNSDLKCGDIIVSAGVNLLHDGQKIREYKE